MILCCSNMSALPQCTSVKWAACMQGPLGVASAAAERLPTRRQALQQQAVRDKAAVQPAAGCRADASSPAAGARHGPQLTRRAQIVAAAQLQTDRRDQVQGSEAAHLPASAGQQLPGGAGRKRDEAVSDVPLQQRMQMRRAAPQTAAQQPADHPAAGPARTRAVPSLASPQQAAAAVPPQPRQQ